MFVVYLCTSTTCFNIDCVVKKKLDKLGVTVAMCKVGAQDYLAKFVPFVSKKLQQHCEMFAKSEKNMPQDIRSL
jgi:hypothetical protein